MGGNGTKRHPGKKKNKRKYKGFTLLPLVLCSRSTLISAKKSARTLFFFPQIAIAIGVLTSKKGGGRRTTLADWTWHQAGAIVGCHCSVLWLGGG